MPKRLVKSTDRLLNGVLGGIADYFGWNKTMIRLVYVAISVFTGLFPGFLVYVIAAVIMPQK